MSRIGTEIECLTRLHELTGCIDDILEFLRQESLICSDEIKFIRSSSNVAKSTQLKLSALSKDNKFQLLTYEWSLLPVERIKVLIVTDRVTKEFAYNY